MPSHFSLNIKTLDKKSSAVVLSIGICKFDLAGILATMEVSLTVTEQVLKGRTVDTERMNWWFKELYNSTEFPYPFPDEQADPVSAIKLLSKFIIDEGSTPENPHDAVNFIWVRGEHFDYAILENLSHQFRSGLPFRHNALRDQRTFCDPYMPHDPAKTRNALRDAIYHATNIQAAARITGQGFG